MNRINFEPQQHPEILEPHPIHLQVLQTSVEPSVYARAKPKPGQKLHHTESNLWDKLKAEIDYAHRIKRRDVHGFVCPTAQCIALQEKDFLRYLRLLKAWHAFVSHVDTLAGRPDDVLTEIVPESKGVRIGSKRIPQSTWDKIQNLHYRLRIFITRGLARADDGQSISWVNGINQTLNSFYEDLLNCLDITLHRVFMRTLHVEGKGLVEWIQSIAQDNEIRTFEQSEAQAFVLQFGQSNDSNGMLLDMKYKGSRSSTAAALLFTSGQYFSRECLTLFEWYPSDKIYKRFTAGMFDTEGHRAAAKRLLEDFRMQRNTKRIRSVSDIDAYAYEQARMSVIEKETSILLFPLHFEALIGYSVHWDTLVESGVQCLLKGYRPENAKAMENLLDSGNEGRSMYLIGRVRSTFIDKDLLEQHIALRDVLPQYIAIYPARWAEKHDNELYEHGEMSRKQIAELKERAKQYMDGECSLQEALKGW